MTVPIKEMCSFVARLATFDTPRQQPKRRGSSNDGKQRAANTLKWPHAQPAMEALARAGFFYRPETDSQDNVQCFFCHVKLDGWEESDDPIAEHLAHSRGCPWATAVSVARDDEHSQPPETRDPLSSELFSARMATFKAGDGWPHEGKKGWRCKAMELVMAGWCWDPSPETGEPDGVTCFYCNLSLDGWEPQDDPYTEHAKREPNCPFIQLVQQYHGSAAPPKKAKGRGAARGSTASKASRLSVQSAVTVASDVPSARESLGDIPIDSSVARVDDSIVTAGTTTSTAKATRGKKKGSRAKVPAKGTVGMSKASQEEAMNVEYPENIEMHDEIVMEEPAPPVPTTSTRRTGRGSKQQPLDSSVVEISAIDAAPPKKTTRGRKAKAQPQSEAEPEIAPTRQTPDADAIAQNRVSRISAPPQDSLEHSVGNFEDVLDQSTPLAETQEPKRGVKRTSDGVRKQQDLSLVELDFPSPKPQPEPKAKRARRTKQASTASTDVAQESVVDTEPLPAGDDRTQIDQPESQGADADDEKSQPAKAKAAPKKGKGKAKGKKSSSSVRSSKATVEASELEPAAEETEDLERDEREIDRELERIAAEQRASEQAAAMREEQDLVDEYEPSPSKHPTSKNSAEMRELEQEVDAEPEVPIAHIERPPAPTPPRKSQMPGGFTPSPSASDKENEPSIIQPVTVQKAPTILLSPTKRSRLPQTASTPNRSPAKSHVSPSKQIGHLQSTVPWTAVDLDAVFLPSPQPSPGRVVEQLVAAAGNLSSLEKQMTVEEWVRYRAAQCEEELKRQSERLVEAFENEGMRGLASLNGINVVT